MAGVQGWQPHMLPHNVTDVQEWQPYTLGVRQGGEADKISCRTSFPWSNYQVSNTNDSYQQDGEPRLKDFNDDSIESSIERSKDANRKRKDDLALRRTAEQDLVKACLERNTKNVREVAEELGYTKALEVNGVYPRKTNDKESKCKCDFTGEKGVSGPQPPTCSECELPKRCKCELGKRENYVKGRHLVNCYTCKSRNREKRILMLMGVGGSGKAAKKRLRNERRLDNRTKNKAKKEDLASNMYARFIKKSTYS